MKNKKTIIGLVILIIGIIIIAIWMPFRNQMSSLDFNIYDANNNYHFETGERLNFVINDTTIYKNRKILWQFGNGDTLMNSSNVNYNFKNKGRYKITLSIDNKFKTSKDIEVIAISKPVAYDSIVKIGGPNLGFVNEELVFSTHSPGVNRCRWEFGESGSVDAYDSQVVYMYKKPGIYYVKLKTNMNKYPVSFRVEILPQFEIVREEPVDSLSIVQNDIKKRFQNIADTKISNKKEYYKNFNYIKDLYTCNNSEKVTVVVNGKYNDLYSYCQGLHYLEGKGVKTVIIDDVKIDTIHCLKRIEVTQSTIQNNE